ncbi:MAG: OmpA family protein [Pelatocladus maniniholoensis HA4357-MV3]|jgi:outer membrane protein OmpA-like peptidoglycan-associated protein|uniref:OmpA family protein n=1 Tax=Pelatocladus maniniholoensis HA4357-MV3 TaxID=1117104 RepID=A0A9E3H599_9NOST|nr:OmpA family protein [Pelatocladus maniniholoensis HA4357-MV3]BAZ68216.1 putative outer membrane protein [Fischerella sp. NIES-4106]
MYLLRFTTYLVTIFLFGTVDKSEPRFPTNLKNNFSNNQMFAKQYLKKQGSKILFSQVQIPNVNFPEKVFPEIKVSEITCSKIRVQENKDLTIITLPADILFYSGKDQIRPQAEKVLSQVSQAISDRYPNTWLQILGHTDSVGSEADNLRLSEQQAFAVQRWLSEKGDIDISLMTKQGYGETQPIAPNSNSDSSENSVASQNNHRIEIVIQKTSNHV